MDDIQLGRAVRALRHRHGWTQQRLADTAGVPRSAISRLENGLACRLQVDAVQKILAGCGAQLRWDVGWRGPELERLLDARHASLENAFKGQLERNLWVVAVEASFNLYGERGRIDLLAFHPRAGHLLVVEVKTQIVDIQALLGALDAKVRLASAVARERGWSPVRTVIPCLVVAESATARRRVEAHAGLFSRFLLRGRAASAWLREPIASPEGLLIYRFQSPALPGSTRRMGRQRVRPTRAQRDLLEGRAIS